MTPEEIRARNAELLRYERGRTARSFAVAVGAVAILLVWGADRPRLAIGSMISLGVLSVAADVRAARRRP